VSLEKSLTDWDIKVAWSTLGVNPISADCDDTPQLTCFTIASHFFMCSGLTDWDITSAWSTLGVFIIGAWAGRAGNEGAVVAALVMSGIAGAAVNAASSIMGDFKTAYYTLAHPRALLCTQVQLLPHASCCSCSFSSCAQSVYSQANPGLNITLVTRVKTRVLCTVRQTLGPASLYHVL